MVMVTPYYETPIDHRFNKYAGVLLDFLTP